MKTPPPMPSMAAMMPMRRARKGRRIVSKIVVKFHHAS